MSDGVIVAAKLGLVAFVVLLGVNPRWPLSRFMFKSRGPRSDVVCLTRRQLFAEGTKFWPRLACPQSRFAAMKESARGDGPRVIGRKRVSLAPAGASTLSFLSPNWYIPS